MQDNYLSCPFIERGITFAPDGLYACSLPLHGLAGWPSLGPYDGGKLPLDSILAKRETLRKQLANGEFNSCNGCDYYLSRKDWKAAGSYLFDNLNIEHYTVCNLRCSYCCWATTHKAAYNVNPYPLLPVFKQLMEGGLMDPKGSVFWGGGEPALLGEFPDCLAYMRSFGVRNDVSSNATTLSKPLLEALPDPSISLMVSVDAGTKEAYASLKRNDLLPRVWDNLEAYGSANGRLMIKYIVVPANNSPSEFEAFVKEAVRRGLAAKCLFFVDMSHESPAVDEEIVKGMALLANMLEDAGASVIAGVHGNHTLPRQMIRSRTLQWKELLRLRKLLEKQPQKI
jgi:wyosine [tRNA(Phe)-imidazoG37] synthetase (radical SAM superfamily)